jgi:ribosomal protein S6--L-glutamate ligase
VVIPRIGATIDEVELAAVYHLERLGTPILNGFQRLSLARDKYLSLRLLSEHGIPVPKSCLIAHPSQLPEAVRFVGGYPLIMKTPRGRQGTDIYLVQEDSFARYLLARPPRPGLGLLVQEFLQEVETEGDVRVIVLGGRPAAWMRRIPRKGEFRANVHLRGRGVPWNPTPVWLDVACQAVEVLGLSMAGVDLVSRQGDPMVLEVNTNPGFREMERVTGIDVARQIIEFAVQWTTGERPK